MNGDYCRPPLGLSLDGNVAENWRKFKQQFTIYMKASGHDKKDSDVKVVIFLNAVGEEAIELFNTFDLQEEDRNDYEKVLTAFENHFTPKINVLVQRFIFNSCMQDIDESFDAFYTDLRKLVKSCEFENQADSVVRDRIVLGIADSGLQERLLREGNLSLARAAEICRAAELSKKQAQTVQTKSVDAMQKKKFQSARFNRAGGNQQQAQAANNKSGAFSGGTSRAYAGVNHRMYTANNDIGNASGADGDQRAHVTNNNNVYICKKCNRKHRRSECSAFGKQCFVCGNYNHFSVVCQMLSVQDVTCITENKETEPYVGTDAESGFFIDSVSVLEVGKVTVTNEWTKKIQICNHEIDFKLDTGAQISVLPLHIFSTFNNDLKMETTNIVLEAYDGYNLRPVGGYQSVCVLNLRKNLKKLENEGIIAKVDNPQGWVSNLVVVEKTDGSIRLCLDSKDLNKVIKRDYVLIPKIEELVPKLTNKKVFSVLDLKDGFFQIELDDKSSDLCTFSSPFGCYNFLLLPMGLSCAPEIFQKRNEANFSDIPGVLVYFDDLLIAGDTIEQHDDILSKVIKRLKN
ncbi:Transposon Ty3-I Gag-Pol polyprotein [Araneus ventricosus]|uniref:Transposon Ty3-I Gag-Pol polyprotein n=1 Tax=Araneus ventricosus TaxID=182803 RepID=A0A4Y2C7E2_ARAVE|nr:Transposon Ty3-I Gag-Pol polyprotein [Araneus ventricosus]